MKKIDYSTLMSAQQQISRDQRLWATERTKNQSQIDGFEAGLAAGMREMISYLKLHGHIVIEIK